jgi:hypothetical protein
VAAETAGAVPLRVAPLRVSQDGRPAAAKVSVPVPPVAVSVWLYGSPEVVAGKEVVVTEGVPSIFKEKVLVLLPPALSVTLRVKVKVPVAVGVPVSAPAPEIASQLGRVIPASVNV